MRRATMHLDFCFSRGYPRNAPSTSRPTGTTPSRRSPIYRFSRLLMSGDEATSDIAPVRHTERHQSRDGDTMQKWEFLHISATRKPMAVRRGFWVYSRGFDAEDL